MNLLGNGFCSLQEMLIRSVVRLNMSSSSSYRKRLCILCFAVLVSMIYFLRLSGKLFYNSNPWLPCKTVLKEIEPPFPAILIDIDFLQDIDDDSCRLPEKPIKAAVSVKLSDSINRRDYPNLDIIFYETTKGRNYIKFFGNVTRATPLLSLSSVGNWRLPKSLSQFTEFWRRSPLLECLDLKMNRTEIGSFLPITDSLEALSKLTKLLVSLDMYPFLNGGSLLGWYRECGIIPHTMDLDIAVLVEQHNPKLLEMFENNETDFFLYRKFGRPNDTYEFTVYSRGKSRPAIDIFFMYNNGRNESWVGGTDARGQKYQYVYPLYDPYCSADLLGHLFWVSCRPNTMLENEYGPNYQKDHKTKHYSWNKSQYNVRKVDKWTEKDMKEV